MILDAEEKAAAMGVPVDLEAQLGRDLNRRCTMKQEYQENWYQLFSQIKHHLKNTVCYQNSM